MSVVVISPSRGFAGFGLKELWKSRELLLFLVWRDITVRYKQTLLGVAWAVLQPAMNMVVFTLFFGRLAGIPSDGIPYPLFYYCGLLPWQLFSTGVTQAANSLVGNQQLIGKVYFPRLIFPISAVLAAIVDFAIATVFVVPLMLWYHRAPPLAILALPLFLLLAILCSAALGIWLAALNVYFRDVRYTVPFVMQLLLLASAIAFPLSMVPARWQPLVALNPMAGVAAGFRWSLVGGAPPSLPALAASTTMTLVGLLLALLWFRRVERTLADVV